MGILRVRLSIGLIAVLMLAATPALAARIALVIGNQKYAQLPVLEKSDGDAAAYAKLFADKQFDKVILKQDLARQDMDQVVADFLDSIHPGDTAVFVYAGHGWSDGSQNFIVGTDAPKKGSQTFLESISLPLSNGLDGIIDKMDRRGAALKVAIIDACRDNPFLTSDGTRSIGETRGFDRMPDPQQGTFVIMSAGAGQTALDRLSPSDANPNGVFTRTFVPLLQQNMTLVDAAIEAQVEVSRLADSVDHKQQPAFYSQVLGKACLSPSCSDEGTPSPVAVPGPSPEQQAYDAAKAVGTAGAFKAFIKSFPDGFYAALAQEELGKLASIATPSPPAVATAAAPAQPAQMALATPAPAIQPRPAPASDMRPPPTSVSIRSLPHPGELFGAPGAFAPGGEEASGTKPDACAAASQTVALAGTEDPSIAIGVNYHGPDQGLLFTEAVEAYGSSLMVGDDTYVEPARSLLLKWSAADGFKTLLDDGGRFGVYSMLPPTLVTFTELQRRGALDAGQARQIRNWLTNIVTRTGVAHINNNDRGGASPEAQQDLAAALWAIVTNNVALFRVAVIDGYQKGLDGLGPDGQLLDATFNKVAVQNSAVHIGSMLLLAEAAEHQGIDLYRLTRRGRTIETALAFFIKEANDPNVVAANGDRTLKQTPNLDDRYWKQSHGSLDSSIGWIELYLKRFGNSANAPGLASILANYQQSQQDVLGFIGIGNVTCLFGNR